MIEHWLADSSACVSVCANEIKCKAERPTNGLPNTKKFIQFFFRRHANHWNGTEKSSSSRKSPTNNKSTRNI